MRSLAALIAITLVVGPRAAFADPHAEMAAALAARIETHPPRAVLPISHAGTAVAASAAGTERGNSQANASATGLVHQALAATANAAGQAQAAAAQARPHPPHPTH